ncbi:hypothetical protein [Brevundimonas nasdae]|uniref:hypothetical protein n=1 Tax=Brevundimonas nasdae TaxID=172043 RepID=UPI003F68BFDF
MFSGAYLDTRRRALGLSIAETAAWMHAPERTINRWINDESAPRSADDLIGRLAELEDMMEAIADGIVSAATDHTVAGPVRLDRYRTQADLDAAMAEILTPENSDFRLPLGAHAMLTAWADDQLAALGVATAIMWA